MSTAEYSVPGTELSPVPVPVASPGETPLHRLEDVRRRQGLTRRAVARRMHVDLETVRSQEAPTSDLTLRTVYAWQKALDVPIAELFVDDEESLSAPVLKRARMVRLMKTAGAILERARQPAVRRMAEMMVDQLVELMPELADITPWHAVGRRRTRNELGQTAYRRLSLDALHDLLDS